MFVQPIAVIVSIDQQSGATRTEAAGERGCGFVRRSTITQLALGSLSPARHITVVEYGAGVGTSRRERYCCATRTEAVGERGCGFVRCSSITQLAVGSLSPARHSTVVEDGAGVVISRRERRFSIVKVGMCLENIERTISVKIPFG